MKPKHLHTAIIVLSLLVVGTQPVLGTWHIPSDTSIGTWDIVNRIYTLTTDVHDDAWVGLAIKIDEDNLTLDGAGHTVKGPGGGGIRLTGRTGVTVRDLTVEDFGFGIVLSKYDSNPLT